MRIGFYLSDWGGSPLQAGLERGLRQLGHKVEYAKQAEHYDLVLAFNQCAHTTNYHYPSFPGSFERLAFIDTAEYGYFKRLPGVVERYWNGFAEGSVSHDTKNREEQEQLRRYLEGRSFPYFIREFSKLISWPVNYHPIDYPLYGPSECHMLPVREEYLNRQLDLFVYWGASHPWRIPITEALRGAHTKCEITIINDVTHPRLPQHQYFAKTRAAKCSVSFDGYGSGSFRVTEVLCRCLLLQGPLSITLRDPILDGVHCVEYAVDSRGEEFLGTNVAEKLRECLADPERSYRIYEAGYRHCMEKYSEKATAQYVLDVIDKHNWSIPTVL